MNIFWLTKNDIFPKSFAPFLKEENINIVHVCTQPQLAFQEYQSLNVDLLVMDFSWYSDTISGLELIKGFLHINPSAKIVLVTSYYQAVVEEKHKSLGAISYFNKNDLPENIIACLKSSGEKRNRLSGFNQFALAI